LCYVFKVFSSFLLFTDPVENSAYFYATYTAESGTLTATVGKDGFADMGTKVLNTVRLLGASGVEGITVNGVAHTDFEVLASGEVLVRNLALAANSPFIIGY
jgi:hypothetical protein